MLRRQRTSPQPNFEFISVSGNNLRGDRVTRRRVRSHAQADYRRRNPPPPQQARTVELDVTPLLDGSLPSATRPPGLLTPLDASWSDPFGTFPVDRSHKSRELWSHCEYFLSINLACYMADAQHSI
jgi:hypothetical protein